MQLDLRNRILHYAAAAALCGLPAAGTPLQAQTQAPAAAVGLPAANAEAKPHAVRFDIEWKGRTTVREILAEVRTKTSANILADAATESLVLPGPCSFRQVNAHELFAAIRDFGDGMIDCRFDGDESEAGQTNASTILSLTTQLLEEPATVVCRVFVLETPLAADEFKETVTVAVDAIETALAARNEAGGGTSVPVVKAHLKSGMLIVSGSADDVDLAGQVSKGLGFEPIRRKSAAVAPVGLDDPAVQADVDAAKRIVLALQAYADDHEGDYPKGLGALAPKYLDAAVLIRGQGFEYDAEAGGDQLIASRRVLPNDRRITGYADGRVELE